LVDVARLGDLHVDLIRRGAVAGHELLQALGNVSLLKLARGEVHVDADVPNPLVLPRRCVAQRAFHRPRVEAEEIGPLFGGNRQRYPAANLSARPSGPQQRFGAYDLPRFGLVDRLIEEDELLLIEGAPNPCARCAFEHDARSLQSARE